MTIADREIALATRDDIGEIIELQKRNLRSNGGSLSIEFSSEWFERVLSEMPIIVARRDGRVVGYLVSSPLTAAANMPIMQAKLRAYPGSHNPYNYGPVCITKDQCQFQTRCSRHCGCDCRVEEDHICPARQFHVAFGACKTRNAAGCRIHTQWRCLRRVRLCGVTDEFRTALGAEHIAGQAFRMDPYQDLVFGRDIPLDQGHVLDVIHIVFVDDQFEFAAVPGRDRGRRRPADQRFVLHPEIDEVRDRDDLEVVFPREELQIGHARHGPVVLHDLADDTGGLQARETGEIDGAFGLAGATSTPPRLRPDGEDVAGADQVGGHGASATATWMVCARSAAEIPVVTPAAPRWRR